MMSLTGAVSRGLRAGWGQLRSRASVRGLFQDKGDDAMDWENMVGTKECPGRRNSHLEPQTNSILGGAKHSACAPCKHKCTLRQNLGTGWDHASADGAGSPEGPALAPEGPALGPDDKSAELKRLVNIKVTKILEDNVVLHEERLIDTMSAFDSTVTSLGSGVRETINNMGYDKLQGVLNLGHRLLLLYDTLASLKIQLAAKEPEYRTAKEVSTCMKAFERRREDLFKKHGVTTILAVGQPFNLRDHTIQGLVVTDEVPPGMVVEVVKEGYRLFGQVIRYSYVYVSEINKESLWKRKN